MDFEESKNQSKPPEDISGENDEKKKENDLVRELI